MASFYPDDQTAERRPRPLRTAALLASFAFIVGAVAMGWALTRWPPAQQWLGGQAVQADAGTPVTPQIVAGLPPPAQAPAAGDAAPLAAPLPAPAVAGPPADIAGMNGRVSDLEARISRADLRAAAAASNAGRAEGLLIAFAARRAIDRGTGLGYLEGQLRERFAASQPRAVALIIGAAQQPVTIAALRQQLDALAPRLSSPATNGDWWTATQHMLGNLFVVRRAGNASPAPDDRLARARLMLDGGQVDGALAEVARMPGAEAAAAWSASARRWIEAHQALDILEAAAILPPPGEPAAPPPSAPAAPAQVAAPAKN